MGRMGRTGILSVLCVLSGGVFGAVLSAQFQMPDPKQMAGIPRPVSDLPDGSISVRLIRGQLSNNITSHLVELHFANGRVLKVNPEKNRLIIEGVNMIKRHTKPNPGKNVKGGIVEREASLHASNVQVVCPECGKATRIGRRILGDGRKVRICRKCEGVVDK